MHKRSRRYTDALTVGVAGARSDAGQEDGQTNRCKDELTGAQTNRERQRRGNRSTVEQVHKLTTIETD